MQCEAFEERLNTVLDERRRPEWDADLAAHTAACPACRQLVACYQAMLDGFYEFAAPEPPTDLAQRVLDDRAQLRRSRIRIWVVGPALATAAALLLALFPSTRVEQAGQTARQTTSLAQFKPRQLGPGTLTNLAVLPESWLSSNDPYEGLAKGTGQNLAAVMLYVPGIAGTRGIIDPESSSTEGEPTWADQMSEGLKPVSDSVAETINLILESLPVAQLASSS